MALDLAKVSATKKALTESLNRSGGSGGGFKFWTPKAGKNKVRIMPCWTSDEDSPHYGVCWREVTQHWNISDSSPPVICKRRTPTLEGDCPVCDLWDELKNYKRDPDAQGLRKKIRPKKTYFLDIVDFSDPEYTAEDVAAWTEERPDKDVPFEVGDPKLQVYAAPSTVFDPIISFIEVNQLDISDLETGHDVLIKKIPHKDRMLTRYEVQVLVKSTPAPVKIGSLDELLDLSEVGFVMDESELMTRLTEGPCGDYVSGNASRSLSAGKPSDARASADDLEAEIRASMTSG